MTAARGTITLASLLLAGLLGGSHLAAPRRAFAFAEDVCFSADGGHVNCFALPPECPPGDTSNACAMALLASAPGPGATDPIGNGGRSTVHVDATYVIAQRLGLSAEDAYWLVAYNEATDLGSYVPRDLDGRNLVDPAECVGAGEPAACALLTRQIDGVTRTNFASGGVFFHFHPPHHALDASPVPGIDGLRPDLSDSNTEVFLVNMRRWAWGEGLGCTAGLTSRGAAGDFATGASCFSRATGRAGNVGGGLSVIGAVAVPLNVSTGLQVISTSGPTPINSATLSALVGEAVADEARLGIYLHALQDRISHHVCGDDSHLTGPYPITGPRSDDFLSDMTSPECTQALHGLRHAWETGVDQSLVPERDRTTAAGLAMTWDELAAYAGARGMLRDDAVAARERVLDGLLRALSEPDASARVLAIREVGCAERLQPMPGHGTCEPLGEGDAGIAFDGGRGDADAGAQDLDAGDADGGEAPEGHADAGGSSVSSAGGCACGAARARPEAPLWLALASWLAAPWLRRRFKAARSRARLGAQT